MEDQTNRPELLNELCRLHNSSSNDIEIPLPAANRRFTDKKPLIITCVLTFLLVPFLLYSLIYADIRRLSGYDNCGNVCGVKNSYDRFRCTGKDFTDKPYLVLDRNQPWNDTETPKIRVDNLPGPWPHRRYCASFCPDGYDTLGKLCVENPTDDEKFKLSFLQLKDDVATASWGIVLSVVLSLGITILFITLFTYFMTFAVWFSLLGLVAFFIIIAAVFWGNYFTTDSVAKKQDKSDPKLFNKVASIFFTIISLVLLAAGAFLFKRIKLMMPLYREVTKAIFAMRSIAFVPILSSLINIVLFSIFLTLMLALVSSGTLTEYVQDYYYTYKYNAANYITMVFCVIMFMCYIVFTFGGQCMIVAGAVSSWYFASNKAYLRSPILIAAKVLFRFHIGTVVSGPIPLAHIQTAMHGEPFMDSKKRADKLLKNNSVNVKALRSWSDFIFGMAVLFVLIVCIAQGIFISVFTGVGYYMAPGFITVFFALIIVLSFFYIYETAMDTIFICFCEDTLLNDGTTTPYAMSKDFMQFIETSKAVVSPKKGNLTNII